MKTIFSFLFLLSFSYLSAQEGHLAYPPAPKSDTKDTIWNRVVNDPYRPLEIDSKQRQDWLDAQKKLSESYFKETTHKYAIEFDANHTSYALTNDIPYRSGPYYIELSPGAIYYKDYLRDRPMFLYNSLMISPKTSFSEADFSRDGIYCALTCSIDGSDWKEIRILNMNSSSLMKDHLYNVRSPHVVWFQNGFFYHRHDSVKDLTRHTDQLTNQKIYYHKIGTDSALDSLIFEDTSYPDNIFSVTVTKDERFVIVSEFFPDENKTVTFFKDYKKTKDSNFKVLFGEVGSETNIIGSRQDTLLAVSTNNGAYNREIVEIDTKRPKQWSVVVENQQKYLIKQVLYAGDKYCTVLQQGSSEYLCVFSPEGDVLKTLSLPTGSANKMICYAPDQNSIVMEKSYYTVPPVGELLSLKDYSTSLIGKTYANYNPSNYKFCLTYYQSRDNTLIPMYIVMAKDFPSHGPGPALLRIYGGFNTSIEPTFDPGIFTFLNNGGIYAVANIRGGSNSVKDWHHSGSLLNKQNSIDDAYYAARYLVDSGFALTGKIALTGSSNGGLVAAAVINQHPEIFKTAILNVGLYDMIRYENYTVGVSWNPEYGSVNDSVQFKNLLSYSPLHNIQSNTTYPSMLITTSQYDDRVPALHTYKYVAALQELTRSPNPILLQINKRHGHGGTNQKEFLAFLFRELNMKYDPLSYYKDK